MADAIDAQLLTHCTECVFQKGQWNTGCSQQTGCFAHSLDPWDFTTDSEGVIHFPDNQKFCQFKRRTKWTKEDETLDQQIERVNREVRIRWTAVFNGFNGEQLENVLKQTLQPKKITIFVDQVPLNELRKYPRHIEWITVAEGVDYMAYATKHARSFFMVDIKDLTGVPTNFFEWLNQQINYRGFHFLEISTRGKMQIISASVRGAIAHDQSALEQEEFRASRWDLDSLDVTKNWDRRKLIWT